MKELPAIVAALHDPGALPAVLATLVSATGSSYRRPGARLLLTADARRLGSISGGCLEEDVISRARRVSASGLPEAVVYDTTSENDLVWGVGLGCHGVVRVLLERISECPEWARQLERNSRQRAKTGLIVRHDGSEPARWGTQLSRADGSHSTAEVFFSVSLPSGVPSDLRRRR